MWLESLRCNSWISAKAPSTQSLSSKIRTCQRPREQLSMPLVSLITLKTFDPVSPHLKSTPKRWSEPMHCSESTLHLGRCNIKVVLFNFRISSMSSSSTIQPGQDCSQKRPSKSLHPKRTAGCPRYARQTYASPVSSSEAVGRF